MPRSIPARLTLGRLVLLAALGAVVATGLGPLASPAPVHASTADTMEAKLLSWINDARARRGLLPLRPLRGLVDLAGDRAASMASSGKMEHASCLSCLLNNRGIQWYMNGEVIAWTSYPWGDQAAQSIFNGWKGSSYHWSLLMSSRTNYIGLGVAYRSSNRTTYAAGVLTESRDYTGPWARMGSGSRKGTSATWSWNGADTRLQTHTAGFKNFDVQFRVGTGTWTTIRSGTTSTSLSRSGLAGGRYYGVRVRSRDNRGYVSGWTAELRVWVP